MIITITKQGISGATLRAEVYGVARATRSQSFAIVATLFRTLPDFRLDIFLDKGIDVTNNVPALFVLGGGLWPHNLVVWGTEESRG